MKTFRDARHARTLAEAGTVLAGALLWLGADGLERLIDEIAATGAYGTDTVNKIQAAARAGRGKGEGARAAIHAVLAEDLLNTQLDGVPAVLLYRGDELAFATEIFDREYAAKTPSFTPAQLHDCWEYRADNEYEPRTKREAIYARLRAQARREKEDLDRQVAEEKAKKRRSRK